MTLLQIRHVRHAAGEARFPLRLRGATTVQVGVGWIGIQGAQQTDDTAPDESFFDALGIPDIRRRIVQAVAPEILAGAGRPWTDVTKP